MLAPPEDSPAPRRRPQISREFVNEHRRRRFVEACAELLHEFGRPGATTTNVVRVAGGARNTFYEVFSSVEECIAHGIALAEQELFAGLENLSGEGEWLPETHAAIHRFYEAVAARPLLAELFLIHSAASRLDAGRAAFRTGGERFAPLLRRGRSEPQALGRRPAPATIEECLSQAIISLAAARVRSPALAALPAQSRQVALLAGGYFLGPEAAEEMLSPRVGAGAG